MIRGTGGDYGAGDNDFGMPSDENKSRRQPNGGGGPPRRKNVDEDDLRKAIEESKRTLAQEQAAAEDRELQEAIQLSKDEEDKRKHAVEDSNASALFDDQNQL
jgi:epsin